MKKAVFGPPVVAPQLQQSGRVELGSWQAGDRVDDLMPAAVAQFTDALDPADRSDPWPNLIGH
jgi:hypothetical protein